MLATIKQVCIFIICAQMLLHFKAEQKYGKYIKFLIGIMVLAQLTGPLMAVFGQGGIDLEKRMNYYMGEGYDMEVIDESYFTEMQMQEIKSIFNNVQSENQENEYISGEGADAETKYMEAEDGNIDAVNTETVSAEDTAGGIIIERIEVMPDE